MTASLTKRAVQRSKRPCIRRTRNNLARWSSELPAFNKERKKRHLPVLTLDEYIDYLHGVNPKKAAKRDVYRPSKTINDERMEKEKKYPSVTTFKGDCTKPDTSHKAEIAGKYTVAIPYNKGGYAVIPNDDIEHIGK